MDKINEFLNHKLATDFLFSDDKVMLKLELCIDKLTKFKFSTGFIMAESIPKIELPSMPFGDFKKLDKTEIINKLQPINNNTNNNNNTATTTNTNSNNGELVKQDRDTLVNQLAKDRLESELKKRDERRRKRREELLARGLNISNNDDFDDDDDYNYEHEDNDDDDDDDDDDKIDKESLMSSMTRPPTPQRSFSDFLSRSRISLTNQSFNSSQSPQHQQQQQQQQTSTTPTIINNNKDRFKTDNASSSIALTSPQLRPKSDYENISNKLKNSDLDNNNNNNNNKSMPNSPMSRVRSRDFNNNNSLNVKVTSPTAASNVASILSNPPPISPSSFAKSSNITSIVSHQSYYQQQQQPVDYKRSPNGIYTRVNLPIPDSSNGYIKTPSLRLNNTAYSHLPQSSSSFLISSAAANAAATNNNNNINNKYSNNNNTNTNNSNNNSSNNRTSSLRNVNNQNINLVKNVAGPSKIQTNPNLFSRVNTPTKQQLQNHAQRIANIQQQQQQQQQTNIINHYPTISIISQTPLIVSPNLNNNNNNKLNAHVTSAYHQNNITN